MSWNPDRIKIFKSGQDEGKIEKGIKIKGDNKIRISGAVIRITIRPRASGYGNDYKVGVWLPNFTQFEASEAIGRYVTFDQFFDAMVEAVTGKEVSKTPSQRKTQIENGFPLLVTESELKSATVITVKDSVDPLKEKFKPYEEPTQQTQTQTETTEPKPEVTEGGAIEVSQLGRGSEADFLGIRRGLGMNTFNGVT